MTRETAQARLTLAGVQGGGMSKLCSSRENCMGAGTDADAVDDDDEGAERLPEQIFDHSIAPAPVVHNTPGPAVVVVATRT